MKVTLLEMLLKEFVADKDIVIDLIKNNRIATIYYTGDAENKPGWRTILPVAFGNHKSKQGTFDYIRAWQWKGKTVRGIPNWKLFRTDRMVNWNLASTQLVKNVPDNRYNPQGDKWMDTLYIHAKFGGENPSGGSSNTPPDKPKPPTDKIKPKPKPTPKPATSATPQQGLEKRKPIKPKQGEVRPGAKDKPEDKKKKLKESITLLVNEILKS